MEPNDLKIELIQKIIACADVEVLRAVEATLNEDFFEVNDEGESYFTEAKENLVPDWYYDTLKEDYEKYKRGELKTSSWEEVKEKLRKKI